MGSGQQALRHTSMHPRAPTFRRARVPARPHATLPRPPATRPPAQRREAGQADRQASRQAGRAVGQAGSSECLPALDVPITTNDNVFMAFVYGVAKGKPTS